MTKWSASDRDKESTALPKVMSACSHASSSERTAAETSILPASGQTAVSVVQLQATGVQGANFRILYKDGPTRKMICSRVGCLFVFVLVCGCRPAAVCAVCAVCVCVGCCAVPVAAASFFQAPGSMQPNSEVVGLPRCAIV